MAGISREYLNWRAVFAYGESEELALQEIKTAIDLWLTTAQNTGREIRRPQGREVLQDLLAEHSRQNPRASDGGISAHYCKMSAPG